jgi:hypothetical protein
MGGKEEISSDLLLLLPDSQFMAMQHIPLIALQLIFKVHRTFGVPDSKEEPFTFLPF